MNGGKAFWGSSEPQKTTIFFAIVSLLSNSVDWGVCNTSSDIYAVPNISFLAYAIVPCTTSLTELSSQYAGHFSGVYFRIGRVLVFSAASIIEDDSGS